MSASHSRQYHRERTNLTPSATRNTNKEDANNAGTSRRRRLYLDRNLLVIFCITLTSIMSVSSITPAFPKVIEEFEISPLAVGLLITVFTFPGVILTPVLGVLADRYGRKRIVVPSLFLFGIAGGACGLTASFSVLLVLRFIQGIGAAALGSLNVTIIGDMYSGRERTTAMGYNSSVLSIGTTFYPVIGGALAVFGWNYPFLLGFLGIPAGLLVLLVLKNPEPESRQSLKEYLQNLIISIKNRRVIGLFISCGITFIILYGSYLTYIPILMSERFGASTVVIGAFMSSVSIITAVTSAQLGTLTKFMSEKTILKTSYILYALSLLLVPMVHKESMLIIPIILFGLAHGTNIPTTISLLASLAPMEYRGAFMATNGMVLRLGQTLGPIIMGIMYAAGGINAAFFAGTVLALLASLFLMIVFRR